MLLSDVTTRDLATALLIRRLYIDLGEPTGGPLHVELDDRNVYDEDIISTAPERYEERYGYLWDGRFEQWARPGEDTSVERRQEIQQPCEAILAALREMAEDHRFDVVTWAWEWVNSQVRWENRSRLPSWQTAPAEPPPEPTAEQLEAATSDMAALLAAVPLPPVADMAICDARRRRS